jgi:hypothetical protein
MATARPFISDHSTPPGPVRPQPSSRICWATPSIVRSDARNPTPTVADVGGAGPGRPGEWLTIEPGTTLEWVRIEVRDNVEVV